MVTSAGIAPLGTQSGSRAGGRRVHRFPTSSLGETLVNSCLCRNKGGSGGDGVSYEEAKQVHDSHGDGECQGEGMTYHNIFVHQETVSIYHLCHVV